MTLFLFVFFFLLIDVYFFQGVLYASKNWPLFWKNAIRIGFWIPTVFAVIAVTWWTFGNPYSISASTRNFVITGVVAAYISKVLGILILFTEDLYRGMRSQRQSWKGIQISE